MSKQPETTYVSPEYKMIRDFYGDRKAERSGRPLIRHIDEGLRIIDARGGCVWSSTAFCLHPMFQDDDKLALVGSQLIPKLDPYVIATLFEYRNVANRGLRKPRKTRVIRKSPVRYVNEMLVADKVQNRRDFERYNSDHPEADDLAAYFKEWLDVLGVSEHEYQRLTALLDFHYP